ncbi:hypothetical protein RKE57_05930 [Stenotrophomonas geniculata]|jgi:hypothetical protein|uniref:Uncharacterized protein n=1 Tax=Stenotrophomonas forensis TaxID=2871169 RepID=A0ABY7Y4J6_9GAMM|nr:MULTISPECIES: hypothetical protein [Stenotrophomonas]PJL06452.1 hypothetical protein B9Y63_04410 [Stenotrophomonas maltophilia]WDM64892.1 hypothetical protein K5L94_06285 [Stenotrophomonas sp. DFS-20110405]WNF11675.1 hypothetical protein RKE57_05930 [Stenotrophomonas geniculata]
MTQRILFVLSSHDRKGPTGAADTAPGGFRVSKASHPHRVLADARYYDGLPFPLADAVQERGIRQCPNRIFSRRGLASERLVLDQNPASAKGVAEAMLPLLAAASVGRI